MNWTISILAIKLFDQVITTKERIMTMLQISFLIAIVGFTVIGLVLYAAYKVAEKKDIQQGLK